MIIVHTNNRLNHYKIIQLNIIGYIKQLNSSLLLIAINKQTELNIIDEINDK